jgi:hypothetical protein
VVVLEEGVVVHEASAESFGGSEALMTRYLGLGTEPR